MAGIADSITSDAASPAFRSFPRRKAISASMSGRENRPHSIVDSFVDAMSENSRPKQGPLHSNRRCAATLVRPTFHPSYLLRNQSGLIKRRVWEDVMQVMERLNMPISDKQRSYFLSR